MTKFFKLLFVLAVSMAFLSPSAILAQCQGGSAASRLSCGLQDAFDRSARENANRLTEAAQIRALREARDRALEAKRQLDLSNQKIRTEQDAFAAKRADEQRRNQELVRQRAAAIEAKKQENDLLTQKKIQQTPAPVQGQANQQTAIANLKQGIDQVPQGKAKEELGAAIHNTEMKSAAQRVQLEKKLASEQQMNENGAAFAGTGTSEPFRGSGKIAAANGGDAGDWVKKSSSQYTSRDGTTFETHWVENVRTGEKIQQKTIFIGD